MHDLLSKLDHEDILALCGMIVGVIAIVGGISVAITKVISAHYRRSQLDEMEATLKMEMIQRGMSAGEIKQVLEANMQRGPTSWAEAFKALTTDQPINIRS
jgi:hypothetical protein